MTASDIQLKRAYEPPEIRDGVRVLVDRLWARGISKDAARLDAWMKELGPTAELRKWFGHQPDRWDGFVEKYRQELASPMRQLLLAELKGIALEATLTLVYGARDTEQNEAVILRQYVLSDTPHPDGEWNASARLLATAATLAAARHDAIASVPALKLFASPIMSEREIDDTIGDLVIHGMLCQSSSGCQVTPLGLQRVRELSEA